MPLEKQVTSREPSKRLAELGVKRESYFFHWKANSGNRGEAWEISTYRPSKDTGEGECYSAFTVAELGEMLPLQVMKFSNAFHCVKLRKGRWLATYNSHSMPRITADTEADARAKMLIYLIENGLLDVTMVQCRR